MKTVLFAFFLFSSSLVLAQTEKELEAVTEKLRLALIDPDTETLARLTSTKLSYGHSNGLIETQAEFIEALVSGKSDFNSITVTNQMIHLANANTAMVRHNLEAEVMDGSNPNTIKLGVFLVWIKENKEWKLLGRQAFRL